MKNVILGICCIVAGGCIGSLLMYAYPPTAEEIGRHPREWYLVFVAQCLCLCIMCLVLLTGKPLIERTEPEK